MNNIPSPLPTTTDGWTERAIKAAGADKAPRVTPDDVKNNIVSEHYFTAAEGVIGAFTSEEMKRTGDAVVPVGIAHPALLNKPLNLLTFCVLVLRNGFTVTGESACASHENFNAQIGKDIAREQAVSKVWGLMGYELRTKLAEAKAKELKYCVGDIAIYQISVDNELNVKFKDGKMISLTVPDDLDLAGALRYAAAQANKTLN